jgi:hypothetical protein
MLLSVERQVGEQGYLLGGPRPLWLRLGAEKAVHDEICVYNHRVTNSIMLG